MSEPQQRFHQRWPFLAAIYHFCLTFGAFGVAHIVGDVARSSPRPMTIVCLIFALMLLFDSIWSLMRSIRTLMNVNSAGDRPRP